MSVGHNISSLRGASNRPATTGTTGYPPPGRSRPTCVLLGSRLRGTLWSGRAGATVAWPAVPRPPSGPGDRVRPEVPRAAAPRPQGCRPRWRVPDQPQVPARSRDPGRPERDGRPVTGYGHGLLFGVLLEPPEPRAATTLTYAELVERVGLDLVSLSDHPYWTDRLDTMSLLAAIAARTSRVRIMSNCANLPLRPPVTLARTAATLDLISGGRFELGLGTGPQRLWDSIVADGGPRRSQHQPPQHRRPAHPVAAPGLRTGRGSQPAHEPGP
ncbi:LLM class flavin-dependent oxidoreductase [Micromonospora sp. NPDC049559]|uniref:LLM class flavin-dependent oxidoreductase n=1 Tax=Micromonospora sp. NPDC049559 TaxID=3155923 RepID=UPI003449A045